MRINVKQVLFSLILVLIMFSAILFARGDYSVEIGAKTLIGADAYTADSTPSAVDVGNYGGVAIIINTGSGSFDPLHYVNFQLTQCASSTGTFTAVEDEDMIDVTTDASGTIYSLVATQSAPAIQKFSYIGGYRYLKLKADFIGAAATATVNAVAIGGHLHISPE